MNQIFTTVPIALVSSVVGWAIAAWSARQARRKVANEQADRLEIHRDDLMFQLLNAAREEATIARTEVRNLQDDNRRLRALEQHFFYFEQSLDHLDAILSATTLEERGSAERNALAFLNRMRRLKDARGAILNEIQLAQSGQATASFVVPPIGDTK